MFWDSWWIVRSFVQAHTFLEQKTKWQCPFWAAGDGRNDGASGRPDGPARPIVTVALFWGGPGTGKSAAAEALGFEFGRVAWLTFILTAEDKSWKFGKVAGDNWGSYLDKFTDVRGSGSLSWLHVVAAANWPVFWGTESGQLPRGLQNTEGRHTTVCFRSGYKPSWWNHVKPWNLPKWASLSIFQGGWSFAHA